MSAQIEIPESKEIVVKAGETLTLKGTGSPDPDKDTEIRRAPNKDGSCSSSEKQVFGPALVFTWRLWKEERSGKRILVGTVGQGRQVQWEAPNEAGVYWIELVVDDDFDPDYDAPAKEKSCEKCTVYDNGDDPAARDWLRVIVQGEVRLVSSSPHHIVYHRPDEPLPIFTPEIPEVIGPEEGEPTGEGGDGIGDPGGEEEGLEEVIIPPQEPEERPDPEPPSSTEPDPELINPTIHFSISIRGYPSWMAQIIIYPVGQLTPIATYTTSIYPSSQTSLSVSWEQIFPNEKPPSGVYTYDIIVIGLSSSVTSLSIGDVSNRDKRLSD
ncbi:MAG: hypothetical protein C4295_04005 [Candidatus Fervidibacterota bacterium]